MDDDTFGSRLRAVRRGSSLTVDEIAERVGVSRPTVWAWENEKYLPRRIHLQSLSEVLQVPEDYLVQGAKAKLDTSPLDRAIADAKAHIANVAGTDPQRVSINIKW